MRKYDQIYVDLECLVQKRNELGNIISEDIMKLEEILKRSGLNYVYFPFSETKRKVLKGVFDVAWDPETKRLVANGENDDGGRPLLECSFFTRYEVYKSWDEILEFFKEVL